MRRVLATGIAISACIAMPASADEFFAVTPSGAAEMLFTQDPPSTIGKLTSSCIDAGWTVMSSSGTELVCEAPLNFGQSIMGTLLMGNSYSTPPRRFFRFNVAGVQGISRVQASGWMELQMAFGQMRRSDFSGPEFHNSVFTFLSASGGQYPKGTTFPNHVFLGIGSEDVEGVRGARIVSVEPGGPAANAGIQVGDVVVKMGRRRVKDTGGWLDAAASVVQLETYPIELERGGQKMTVNVARAFRPTIDTTVEPAVIAVTPPVVSVPSTSVADEIAKLAKLRADGVLTESEFQSAKTRLLPN